MSLINIGKTNKGHAVLGIQIPKMAQQRFAYPRDASGIRRLQLVPKWHCVSQNGSGASDFFHDDVEPLGAETLLNKNLWAGTDLANFEANFLTCGSGRRLSESSL